MRVHMSEQPSNENMIFNDQEQESLDESLKNLLKQKEQMDLTENVQPHFSVSEMR